MRRPLRLFVALALAGLEIAAGTARAQVGAGGRTTDADVEPPVIELETLDEVRAADSQVFTAQVVDDRDLRDVRLYHRRAGKQAFEAATMRAVGDSAFHSVTLATDPADLRAIEYYVQARDGGGNRSVAGFAFEPFVRRLTPAAPAPLARAPATPDAAGSAEPAPARDAGPSLGSRVRWWHVALGVVAAGTLAALAGGGGGGGGSDGSATSGQTVPLTINLGEPVR